MDNPKGKKLFEVLKFCVVKKKGSSEDVSRSNRSQNVKTKSQSLKEKGVSKEHDSDFKWDEDWFHYLNTEDFKRRNQEV